MRDLRDELQGLKHGKKRTAETKAVYDQYKTGISRREFNELVAQARREVNGQKKDEQKRVFWHNPDIAWTVDDSDLGRSGGPEKLYLNNIQDLHSKYKFPPLTTLGLPCGEEVAGHLSRVFAEFGRPLFLKRDNHGNLNHSAVESELEEHMVIPLNSPTYYAQYNGSIEHSQGEYKSYFKTRRDDYEGGTSKEKMLLTEIAAHDLNHRLRRSQRNLNACRAYFGGDRVRFSKRERKEVFLWIRDLSLEILDQSDDNDFKAEDAWRVAAEAWLKKNGFITVVRSGKVLPNFSQKIYHN